MVRVKGKVPTKSVMLSMFVVVGILGMLLCGYGYAAMSTDLLIAGEAKIMADVDMRNVDVRLKSTSGGGNEGNNSDYSAKTASVYPQIPQANGEVVYEIETCNESATKSYELAKILYPIKTLGNMTQTLENVEAGTDFALGTIVGPGDCVISEVKFKQGAGNNVIAALRVEYEWQEYNGTPFVSEYMQDFTSAECVATSAREVKQMKDRRDGKTYWVGKVKTGQCWMMQNLAYDGGGEKLTAANVSTWLMANHTNDPIYYQAGDNAAGHSSNGNYYSFAAVNNHSDPVCPANWRVPTDGDFNTLHNAIDTNTATLYNTVSKAPFYYLLNGWASNLGIDDVGGSGYFRTSTPNTANMQNTRVLYILQNNVSMQLDAPQWGGSVRCIADDAPTNYPTEIQDITKMSEMTAQVCANSLVGSTKQLIDDRDGKKYWVTKYPDKQCWMAQNLDYDGGGVRHTTADMSSWAGNWSGVGAVAQYMYVGDNANGHNSEGSLYSFDAAQTVCPAGWRLPAGDTTGDLYKFTNYKYNTSSTQLTFGILQKAPFYYRMSGWAGLANGNAGSPKGWIDLGKYGAFWTSTLRAGQNNAFHSQMWDYTSAGGTQSFDMGTGSSTKGFGYSVRCLYSGS